MIPHLAERITRIRLKNNLSQADFAARIGVDTSMVSHYESGGRQPSLETLRKIAANFHVSTDYLLSIDKMDVEGITVDTKGLAQEQVDSLLKIINTIIFMCKRDNEELENYKNSKG